MDNISQQILEKYQSIYSSLPANKGKLKFGRSSVNVSSIARQFYCEKELELSLIKPLPQTARMINGGSGHQQISSRGEALSPKQAIIEAAAPRRETIRIYEFDIAWVFEGVPILGKIDEAWFKERNVELVVERKFSNNLKVYKTHHIQAQLYCLGLGEMGFTNASCQYRIEILKSSCTGCEYLADLTCPMLAGKAASHQCSRGESICYLFGYDPELITGELEWALDYWLGKRDAVPTQNKTKCLACRYKASCDSN